MTEKKGAIPSEVVEKSATLHTASFTPHPQGPGLSEEKQIEEIRKDIFNAFGGYAKWEEDWQSLAEAIYNAGYRKQSEWISVDERLPSESGKYLVCTKRGNVYQTKFYSYPENSGGHWGQKDKGKSITYWMRMPVAPKGGE